MGFSSLAENCDDVTRVTVKRPFAVRAGFFPRVAGGAASGKKMNFS